MTVKLIIGPRLLPEYSSILMSYEHIWLVDKITKMLNIDDRKYISIVMQSLNGFINISSIINLESVLKCRPRPIV